MSRLEILQKLAAGEITVDEATRLLQETAEADPAGETQEEKPKREEHAEEAEPAPEKRKNGERAKGSAARWLHIRVGRVGSERDHVRVNIPIGLVDVGLRLGAHFGDHKWSQTLSDMLDSIHRGEIDTLVEVEDDNSGERVRIFVD